ncbi:unnamed protein product [Mycena citricolor]|uniref:Glycosyltransferase family 15 protein n=1 Tax=Mycena citricolor TaxID=2018698 RepID=A0AAD2HPS9_9AGAR|nr:unnamed protein product [Mycena citricolor]
MIFRKRILLLLLTLVLLSTYVYHRHSAQLLSVFYPSRGAILGSDELQSPPLPKIWREPPYKIPMAEKYYQAFNTSKRASAAIVILARNRNLPGVVQTLIQFEQKFNHKFNYPYVFLNEVPFDEAFKVAVTALTRARVEFGLVPPEDWYQPSWIDENKASAVRERMKNTVLYGDSVSYRNMCRFQSGFFFRHELLKKYRWYWRVEPDVKFSCDLDFDPFLFMEGEDKRYAFTISLGEYRKTIPSLWTTVRGKYDNAMEMLIDRRKGYYNRCHFWSNFEIADLDLWRSESYLKYFDFLDRKGGFYYEVSRWGDAPVHTLGAAMFLRKDQIHFFNEIGYFHMPYEHCPEGPAFTRGRCECDPAKSFDRSDVSCLANYDAMFRGEDEEHLEGIPGVE